MKLEPIAETPTASIYRLPSGAYAIAASRMLQKHAEQFELYPKFCQTICIVPSATVLQLIAAELQNEQPAPEPGFWRRLWHWLIPADISWH